MKYLALFVLGVLAGCDPELAIRLEAPIPQLPPDVEAMSDAKFEEFYFDMSETERVEFVEQYGKPEPRDGFQAVKPVVRRPDLLRPVSSQ